MSAKPFVITVELSDQEALALAQFCKRVTFSTVEAHSDPTREDEPYVMMDALSLVQRALAKIGYAPR